MIIFVLKAMDLIEHYGEGIRRMTGRVLLWGLCFNQKDFGLAFEEIEMPESESRSRRQVRETPGSATRPRPSCS